MISRDSYHSLISFEEFVRGSKEDRVSVVEDKRDLKLIFSRVELKHLKLTLAYVGFQIKRLTWETP